MSTIRIAAAAGLAIGCTFLMIFALVKRRTWPWSARITVMIGVSMCAIGAAAAAVYIDASMRALAYGIAALYLFTGAVYLRKGIGSRSERQP